MFENFSTQARSERAAMFRQMFGLGAHTRILDHGSESGANIHAVLDGTPVRPENIYIADINPQVLERGRERYGFQPVLVDESGKLPFPDGYFDIVYCNSVIEHVTLPKSEIWTTRSSKEFRERSLAHQRAVAPEIQRVGRQFFVQTPYRWFVLEAHSWLPFVGWLPRELVVRILKHARKFWRKCTAPDWHLLNKQQLASMFDGAEIRDEK